MEVSAEKDWYNLYGYYPVITEVDYINDNDENWEAGSFNEGFENGVSLVSCFRWNFNLLIIIEILWYN